MKVDILASGSGGNCVALRSGSTTILIDAGIPKTKIEKRLLDAGIRPDEINSILITHAHSDHIKGLPLANKYRIPVCASEGEWKSIDSVEGDLRNFICTGYHFTIGGEDWFDITPFTTHHDAYEPVGYAIMDGESKCSICLDTGHIDHDMFTWMTGSDIYIIESNHDPAMVEASDYPLSVQARILSDIGHLSNEQTAEALSRLVQGKGERIYLTHISHKNNFYMLAKLVVEKALKQKGFTNGKHYFLEVV